MTVAEFLDLAKQKGIMIATAGTVLVLTVFASVWRWRFNRGPLEALLRVPKLRRTPL